jgi:hypothetical protein
MIKNTDVKSDHQARVCSVMCLLCQSLSQRAQCSAPTAGERLRGLRGVYLYLRQVTDRRRTTGHTADRGAVSALNAKATGHAMPTLQMPFSDSATPPPLLRPSVTEQCDHLTGRGCRFRPALKDTGHDRGGRAAGHTHDTHTATRCTNMNDQVRFACDCRQRADIKTNAPCSATSPPLHNVDGGDAGDTRR